MTRRSLGQPIRETLDSSDIYHQHQSVAMGTQHTSRLVCLHVDVVYFAGPDIHRDLPVTGINIYRTNNWMHVKLF